jgi:translation initiation factor IF-2
MTHNDELDQTEDKADARKADKPKTLSLTKTVEGGKVKQNFQRGRTKTVTVEVKRTRTFAQQKTGGMIEVNKPAVAPKGGRFLTNEEREARMRALQDADKNAMSSLPPVPARTPRTKDEPAVENEAAEAEQTPATVAIPIDEVAARNLEAVRQQDKKVPLATAALPIKKRKPEEESEENKNKKIKLKASDGNRRSSGKLTVVQALGLDEERTRSLASLKRQRAKGRMDISSSSQEKFAREVIIPDIITVQELANRMAERAVDVVKALMKLGTMATASQSIDADTAEIVVGEFGHKPKRVSESDVEVSMVQTEDEAELLLPRPPVVTVMGHVDHGKTSLLDALRKTDVVAGEAGGITQHIGAYQVALKSGARITFLDTPGHEAFTAMRARGAKATDIVVLVVAADDGIMPQTIEALNHAKAANVPIIVAINKIDKPEADIEKVKSTLMNYGLVPEDFGGDTITVPVSAKTGVGLDTLEEAILLQAEVLELKANPNRTGSGTVIEAKVDKGRGTVATLLVQRGTLKVGDIVVAGSAYGKIRAVADDKARALQEASPSQPVEVLGLSEPPASGEEFAVVESEKVARDITEYRKKKERDRQQVISAKTLDQLFATRAGDAPKELAIIVKSDVHGSGEAIAGSIAKFDGDEVKVKISHQAVGAITESDISLAAATGAMVVGFNVRATPKAKEMAEREKIHIRYYAIIYDLIDDVKKALSGMLSPDLRENLLGYAEIREVFNITKYGKVAGCMVTDGLIKRGAKVRLLRDNVVIHEGTLKTLKRFKDEVKEVKSGYECGMAFENYEDIKAGDQIEAFEMQEFAREVTAKQPDKPEKQAESA